MCCGPWAMDRGLWVVGYGPCATGAPEEARHVWLEVLGAEEERDELGAPLFFLEDDKGVASGLVLREQQALDLPLALTDALLEPLLLPPLPPHAKGAPRPRTRAQRARIRRASAPRPHEKVRLGAHVHVQRQLTLDLAPNVK